MKRKKIPARSEISVSDTWDLTQLFTIEDEYRANFNRLANCYAKIAEFKGHLGESAQSVLACLESEKTLDLLTERLGHYASLKNAEDSSNNENLARHAELTNLLTKVRETTSFISPELQQVSDADFERFIEDPLLTEWVVYLKKLRRYKQHTLSQSEERLLALSAPAIRGHSETFAQLTNVDMKFGTLEDEDRQLIELSQSTYSSLLHRPNRDLR
ncbi:MAG: oligoendopeptidase F, partial [Verrucomicrobia bacterium]|nr:oligoendopeptidase F [Verrucomicrobiota bacterium]